MLYTAMQWQSTTVASSWNGAKYITEIVETLLILNDNTHQFNGPLSRTMRVSQYQKGKINLDFTEARDSECQWCCQKIYLLDKIQMLVYIHTYNNIKLHTYSNSNKQSVVRHCNNIIKFNYFVTKYKTTFYYVVHSVFTSVRTSRTDLNWFDMVAKCV